jgi:hypothetical protein
LSMVLEQPCPGCWCSLVQGTGAALSRVLD